MKEDKGKISKIFNFLRKIPSLFVIAVIYIYKTCISPFTPSSCRFYPTCSEYGIQAIRKLGFLKGGKLTIKRILKCRPKGPYGYDPVPEECDSKYDS